VKSRLRVLRAEREWSQAELAQRVDVSRQTVNAIETGKYDPSLPLAFKLARLFGITIEDIFDPGSEAGVSLGGSQTPRPLPPADTTPRAPSRHRRR
jgi:putative transcriptional regulator